jgi:hypothetical protein
VCVRTTSATRLLDRSVSMVGILRAVVKYGM